MFFNWILNKMEKKQKLLSQRKLVVASLHLYERRHHECKCSGWSLAIKGLRGFIILEERGGDGVMAKTEMKMRHYCTSKTVQVYKNGLFTNQENV